MYPESSEPMIHGYYGYTIYTTSHEQENRMKGMVPPDAGSKVSQQCFAVVYVPRKSRNRFPAGCVQVVEDADLARTGANPDEKQYAAIVHGPSKSSEGQLLYYLIEWLE